MNTREYNMQQKIKKIKSFIACMIDPVHLLLMNKKSVIYAFLISLSIIFLSCEEFFYPDQELVIEEDDMFRDWSEYRSAEMGIYALQQNLVEQLVVLGELRGDLLQVTENATPDLVEVYNFNISRENEYASPENFYKLIAACNNLGQQLERAHPEVLNFDTITNNYDRLYGEIICMRAWAYFNAVRIYGEIPYIAESLTSVEEIEAFVNSPAEYIDSVDIYFAPDGYENDTLRNIQVTLEKKYINQQAVIDTFTRHIDTRIKAVGVNHHIDNNDLTWSVTVWNDYARDALMGQMYFFDGDYTKAIQYFRSILYNYTSETSNIKYGLDDKFARGNWRSILTDIDPYEHIYTLWFGKSYYQTHDLQRMFSILPPNEYMMKPSPACLRYFESIFYRQQVDLDNERPDSSKVIFAGIPGDFYRGYGVSYKYYKNNHFINEDTIREVLWLKTLRDERIIRNIMDGAEPVVTKYSIGKDEFAHDANFIIFRAGGIHLYAAEIFALWEFDHSGIVRPETNTSLNILNDGSYNSDPDQMGVRGRVGFGGAEYGTDYDAVKINNIIYKHDPNTNEIIGYYDYTGNLAAKQKYLVEKILEERARELAFEGERFYDLMRIAKRRNDPAFLADRVAAKFEDEGRREAIRAKLMNEENWYVGYFK